MHTVVASDGVGVKHFMPTLSSTCFNKLFMPGKIPSNTLTSTLEQSDSSDALEYTLKECVALINKKDGFTVVYWYSRGQIKNKALISLNLKYDSQVDEGRLNFHIIQIIPTNRYFLSPETLL